MSDQSTPEKIYPLRGLPINISDNFADRILVAIASLRSIQDNNLRIEYLSISRDKKGHLRFKCPHNYYLEKQERN